MNVFIEYPQYIMSHTHFCIYFSQPCSYFTDCGVKRATLGGQFTYPGSTPDRKLSWDLSVMLCLILHGFQHPMLLLFTPFSTRKSEGETSPWWWDTSAYKSTWQEQQCDHGTYSNQESPGWSLPTPTTGFLWCFGFSHLCALKRISVLESAFSTAYNTLHHRLPRHQLQTTTCFSACQGVCGGGLATWV